MFYSSGSSCRKWAYVFIKEWTHFFCLFIQYFHIFCYTTTSYREILYFLLHYMNLTVVYIYIFHLIYFSLTHTLLNVYISLCLIIIVSLFYIFYFSQSACLLPQREKYGTFHFYKNTSLYEGSSACVHLVLIIYYTYIFMVVLLPLNNQSDYLFHHYGTWSICIECVLHMHTV